MKDTHSCHDNGMMGECSVCQDSIHSYTKGLFFMPCLHIMHMPCYIDYISSGNYRCPVCKATAVGDPTPIWESMKYAVDYQPMPSQYEKWMCMILCNDCHKESEVKYHFVAMKCPECSGWNTDCLQITGS